MSSWCSKCDFQECGPLGVHKCYCGHFRREHVCDEPDNAKPRAIPPTAAQLEANRGTVLSLEELKKNTSAESGADQGICPTCHKILGWEAVLIVGTTRIHKACASTKVCAKCKGPVAGAYVGSGGQYFHKECAGLTGICPGCNQTLSGQMVTVSGKKYHSACLKCATCKKNVVDGFLQKGELVYCEPCFEPFLETVVETITTNGDEETSLGKFEEKYSKWTTAIFGGGQPSPGAASASNKWAVTKPAAKDDSKEKEKKAAEKAEKAAREAEMREKMAKEKEAKDRLAKEKAEAKEKEKTDKEKEKADKAARASASKPSAVPIAPGPPSAIPQAPSPPSSVPLAPGPPSTVPLAPPPSPSLPSSPPRNGPALPARPLATASLRMALPPPRGSSQDAPSSPSPPSVPSSPSEPSRPPRALSPAPPMRLPSAPERLPMTPERLPSAPEPRPPARASQSMQASLPPPRAKSPEPKDKPNKPPKDKPKDKDQGEAEGEESDRKIITFLFGEEVKKIRLPPLTVKLVPLQGKLLKAFPAGALALSFIQGGTKVDIVNDEILLIALTTSDVIHCEPAKGGAPTKPRGSAK